MARLEGKVAVITGGRRGIGKAIAFKMLKEGAKVTICDLQPLDKPEELKLFEGNFLFLECDVTNPEDTKNLADETYKRFGKIDILVNNAALYAGLRRSSSTEIPPEEFDKVMAVNVKGVWLCSSAVFPYMKSQRKGKIINLASEVFFTGSHGFAHYVASKGAVIGLTRALANEFAPYNICVNAVAPGFLDTEASRTIANVEKYDVSQIPLGRLGKPEDVVGAVIFLASDEADFITGQTIVIDGGRVKH